MFCLKGLYFCISSKHYNLWVAFRCLMTDRKNFKFQLSNMYTRWALTSWNTGPETTHNFQIHFASLHLSTHYIPVPLDCAEVFVSILTFHFFSSDVSPSPSRRTPSRRLALMGGSWSYVSKPNSESSRGRRKSSRWSFSTWKWSRDSVNVVRREVLHFQIRKASDPHCVTATGVQGNCKGTKMSVFFKKKIWKHTWTSFWWF